MNLSASSPIKEGSKTLLYTLPTITERIELALLFSTQRPLEVELGCGDASFIAEYAKRHPERNFLGVERLLGRIKKLDRKGRRAGLTNLCGVRIENTYFLEWLLPHKAAEALHIYFPDPWPKKRHRHHRLVSEGFPALAGHSLVPGGVIYLRTDDKDYFDQMLAVFGAARDFTAVETPAELSEVRTDFETAFNAEGIPTLRAAYRWVEIEKDATHTSKH